MDLINAYKTFLNNGKTERECVTAALELAQAKGFRDISTYDELRAGDRVYVVNHEKSVALFVIGQKPLEEGISFVTAHIDSPRLDLKVRPVYEKDGLVYFNTHYYGGIKKYQWLTMPLAIHGVVFRKDGSRVDIVVGEDEDGPSFCISDILPHMAQEQMKKTAGDFIPGESLDIVIGLNTEAGKDNEGRKAILDIIRKEYKIEEEDFLSAELEVVPAGRARSLGFDSSMYLRIMVMCVLVDLAASFFPLPGGTGMNEISFSAMFTPLFGNVGTFWAMLIWRFFSYYIFLLQGIIILSYDMAYGNRKYRWQVKKSYLVEESRVFKQQQIDKFRADRLKRRRKTQGAK